MGTAVEPPLCLRWEDGARLRWEDGARLHAFNWEPARAADGRVNAASLRGELKGSSWEPRFMDRVIKTAALHMGTARPAWPGS